MKTVGRCVWIDVAKGIGILLVVLAHTRFPTIGISQWINSFHMPLFFVMAGLCYDENRYSTYWSYFKRKCAVLLYPYISLSLLVIALMGILYLGDDPEVSTYTLLCNMCKGGTTGAFWFIWVLLEVELCYAILAKCVVRTSERLIFCALCGTVAVSLTGKHLPYLLDIMMLALPFYGVGHCFRPVLFEPNKKLITILVLLGAIQITILYFAFPYKVGFAANDLHVPYLFFILAVTGTASVSGVSMLMSRVDKCRYVMRVLVFLGKNSIIILATHNSLGFCRASWVIRFPWLGVLWSQMIEVLLLLTLLFSLSGPFKNLIRIPPTRKN